jgi:hypothetical protein
MGFFDRNIGGFWKGVGSGFSALFGGPSPTDPHKKKKAHAPWDQSQQGQGAGLLSSLDLASGIKGAGLMGGGRFTDRGPELYRAFLLGEMGPGGYLSKGQTSLETAGRINDINTAGRGAYQSTLSGLGASGLSRRYAAPIAQDQQQQIGFQANEALTASMGEANSRRFGAMLAYVNAASQSALWGKAGKTNLTIAKEGAAMSQQGGQMGAAGNIVGGIIGAAASASDRRVKKNIVPVGREGGQNVYEFEYTGRFAKQSPGRYRGVMADEVERDMPHAVVVKGGVKHVDYSFLGTKMRRVA